MKDELNPLARLIVSNLVFEETFAQLLADIKDSPRTSVTDELKQLIGQDLVKPCRDLETENRSGLMYDSDKLENYSFILTGKGMKMLENILKSTKN